MNRRAFIQNSSMAALGMTVLPSRAGAFSLLIPDAQNIKKVHLIFKTHLDIGFTHLGEAVIKTYMGKFIPGALTLSERTREMNQNDLFVWTTGSWLIYEFLERADGLMRKRMESAIEKGDIIWHGLPFTTHTELADPSLYDLGIQLSAILDKRFGKKTISAKMTDVPGHTRGIIPILAKNGIRFLHIGVNSASTPPDVPPLFVWRAPDGTEIDVMYQKEYGSQMILPGTNTAAAICFTSDNHGPQTPEQISKIYNDLRKQFPNAEITASSLNAIADEISLIRTQLPVITQELGDTWIHGAGSDPLKISRFREISRLRLEWLKDKKIEFSAPTDIAFGLPLLMVAEHTWGLDVKTFLKDWDIYAPEAFKAARNKPNFKLMEQSWQEKRKYIDTALENLPIERASETKEKLESLQPVRIDKNLFTKIKDITEEINTQFFKLQIDSRTGAVIKIEDKDSGIDWASEQSPLCLFSYQTFSSNDYERYQDQYLIKKVSWALNDFGKPGQETGHAISETWMPSLESAYIRKDDDGQSVILELVVNDSKGEAVGGCARNISIKLFFPYDRKEMQVTLQWFNKQAYRLPEASWLSFMPPVKNGLWIVNKMGMEIDFRDVIKNGNRKLHAVLNGVMLESKNKCSIESLDAPLAAFGDHNLLNFDNRLPEVQEGVHFCLHNNVWGTNFAMWFEDDMKYRFVFKV